MMRHSLGATTNIHGFVQQIGREEHDFVIRTLLYAEIQVTKALIQRTRHSELDHLDPLMVSSSYMCIESTFCTLAVDFIPRATLSK